MFALIMYFTPEVMYVRFISIYVIGLVQRKEHLVGF